MKFIKIVLMTAIAVIIGEKDSHAQTDLCKPSVVNGIIADRSYLVNEARENIAKSELEIQQNPQDVSAYIQLGSSFKNLCHYDESLENYNYVLDNSEDRYLIAEAYIGTGYLWRRQKNLEKALVAFRNAVGSVEEKGELAAKAYMGIGQVLESQNQLEDATLAYEKAIALREKPTTIWSYFELLHVLERQKRIDEATQIYWQQLGKHPNDPDVINNFGIFLFRTKQYNEAESLYRLQVNKSSADIDDYIGLGQALFGQEKQFAASKAYETGVAFYQPDKNFRCSPHATLKQSETLIEQGFYDVALLLCMKEESFFGKNANRTNYIGEILLKQERYDEALAKFKEALELSPDHQQAQANLQTTKLVLDRLQNN